MSIVDYVLLGRMKAEFKDACKRIDQVADTAETTALQSAWQNLTEGNLTGRDHFCSRVEDAQKSRYDAKLEAWLRIGEKYGLDRETALEWRQKAIQ